MILRGGSINGGPPRRGLVDRMGSEAEQMEAAWVTKYAWGRDRTGWLKRSEKMKSLPLWPSQYRRAMESNNGSL